jgi:hypothetical protein
VQFRRNGYSIQVKYRLFHGRLYLSNRPRIKEEGMLVRRLYNWLRQLLATKYNSRHPCLSRYTHLQCELLESRACPAELRPSPLSASSELRPSPATPPALTAPSFTRTIPITGPTTITRPGVYQLQNDIAVQSGVALTIAASDVVIDLNGYSLIGPGSANTTSIGIWASNRDRITIRNGTIDNFFYGVYLSDSADYVVSRGTYFDQGGHVIENVRFYGNTFRAIRVEGVANVIRDNIIYDTGGSRVYNPTYAAAIETYGPGTVVENNIIYNIRGNGYGILVSNLGAGSTIQNNIITATAYAPVPNYSALVEGLHDQAITYAIAVRGPTTNAIVSANTVANFDYGIAFLDSARGLIADNSVANTAIPFFAPSGAGPVVLSDTNTADRLDYIVASASGLISSSGRLSLSPAPRRSISNSSVGSQSAVRRITTPTVITQPGYYRLDADLRVSSGIAIQIESDDVIIDLNGHALIGPGTASNTAIGVYATGRSRIRITNGSISGFQYGIYLADGADAVLAGRAIFDSSGHVIENVGLYGNTFRAIRVEGRGNVIRNNIIEDTGGCNLYSPTLAAGVEVLGPGNIVAQNHIYAMRGQGVAIYVSALASGTVVQANTVTQANLGPSAAYRPYYEGLINQAVTWGIRNDANGDPVLVVKNTVANFTYNVGFTSPSKGLIDRNVSAGFSIPYFAANSSVYFASTNIADRVPVLTTQDTNIGKGTTGNPSPAHIVFATGTGDAYPVSGPMTITRPGIYVLQQDILYNGNGAAITINASNVTLDLNGYQIIGPGTSSNTAIGVYARNRDQITIRNGTVRGFMYGIYISDDSDRALSGNGFDQGRHVIENLRLIGNTFRGIRIEGRGNIVRNNVVEDTGGTSVYSSPVVMGIESLGPGALIANNYVYAIRGNGYGIAVTGYGGGTIIANNKLSNSSLSPTWSYRPGTDGVVLNSSTYGIYVGDKNNSVIVQDNDIINYRVGIAYHPNSGGLIAANAITQAQIAIYTPGRPDPLVVSAPNNSMDPGNGVVTTEIDLLPTNSMTVAPSRLNGYSDVRQGVVPVYAPVVITAPGKYVLQNDIRVTRGIGIEIRASDVVIDLNGFSIMGPGTKDTRAIGIYALKQNRIEIRNGTIQGFLYGVLLSANQDNVVRNRTGFANGGHVISNLRLVNNTFRGMRIEGRGNIVRNNLVINTGGTSVHLSGYAFGIEVTGPGSLVENNVVYNSIGTEQTSEGVGISVSTLGGGSVVRSNIVANSGLSPSRNYAPWPGNSTSTWGIWIGDTAGESAKPNNTSGILHANLIINARHGITIHPMSRGLMARNTAVGAIVPFYTPVRIGPPLNSADETNQADKSPAVYTVEAKY